MTTMFAVGIPKTLWMTANRDYGRGGHKQRIIRDLHWLATVAARNTGIQTLPTPCTITWTIHYPKGVGRADAPNSYPTCKALLDGLVKGGLLPDDNELHVVAQTWRRGPNLTSTGRYEITIEVSTP